MKIARGIFHSDAQGGSAPVQEFSAMEEDLASRERRRDGTWKTIVSEWGGRTQCRSRESLARRDKRTATWVTASAGSRPLQTHGHDALLHHLMWTVWESILPAPLPMSGLFPYLTLCSICRDLTKLDVSRSDTGYHATLGTVTVVPTNNLLRRLPFLLHQHGVDIAINTLAQFHHFVMPYPTLMRLSENTNLELNVVRFPTARFPRHSLPHGPLDFELVECEIEPEWFVHCVLFLCTHSCREPRSMILTPATFQDFKNRSLDAFPCCREAEKVLISMTGPDEPSWIMDWRWHDVFAVASQRLRERLRNRSVRHQTA